jgi:hypothetical protein
VVYQQTNNKDAKFYRKIKFFFFFQLDKTKSGKVREPKQPSDFCDILYLYPAKK